MLTNALGHYLSFILIALSRNLTLQMLQNGSFLWLQLVKQTELFMNFFYHFLGCQRVGQESQNASEFVRNVLVSVCWFRDYKQDNSVFAYLWRNKNERQIGIVRCWEAFAIMALSPKQIPEYLPKWMSLKGHVI